MRRVILSEICVVLGLIAPLEARAQQTCIQQYFQLLGSGGKPPISSGVVPRDVETIAAQVVGSVGITMDGIRIVPCSGTKNARAMYFAPDQSVPQGDYIIYDADWVRLMVGPLSSAPRKQERDEAVFLFAHELGHLVGRHFTANKDMPRIDQELAADKFAGCAAGALSSDWENVRAFLSRMRPEADGDYPSRARSIETVQASFDACKRSVSGDTYKAVGEGPSFSPPMLNGRTLDGCMITPQHPNGDDCSVQASQTIAARFCEFAGFLSSRTFTTEFTPAFKASYKFTRYVGPAGTENIVLNKDDSGGYIINRVECVR